MKRDSNTYNILMYSHDTYGLGHIRRTLAIATPLLRHPRAMWVVTIVLAALTAALTMAALEDLYLPFRPKRRTSGRSVQAAEENTASEKASATSQATRKQPTRPLEFLFPATAARVSE